MEKKRSKGITILGICLLLCAVPALFAALIGMVSQSYAKGVTEVVIDIIMRILFISSPLTFISAGVGMLNLKNWARIMVMFIFPIPSFIAISISGSFLNVIMPPDIVSLMTLLGTAVMSLAIIFYLTRPKVKEQFK